jgi:hypothetical protein
VLVGVAKIDIGFSAHALDSTRGSRG